jgi:hypothetical protein
MAATIYEFIGRAVVRAGWAYAKFRFGTQLRFALGFGIVALLLGGYLASRNVREG